MPSITKIWRALTAAQRDMAVIGMAMALAWLVIERTETCDRLFAWIAANPEAEADSVILAFILGSLGVTIFARRRLQELRAANRAREQVEHEFQTLAYHDPLTGLPNRRALSDRLQEAHEVGEKVALILLDLDRFKWVNDLHGHGAGDRLLRQVATRINETLRPGQRAFRLGGDEFAVITRSGVGQDHNPSRVAEKVVEALSRPFEDSGLVHHIGASAGIARFPADGADPTGLIRAADVALYAAKDAGRACVRHFEPDMDARIRERAGLEQQLRAGIQRGEFVPHFQPIVSLKDGTIGAYEVLARWDHPDGQEIGPDVFIPIADECGLINELTLSIIDQACGEARDWDPEIGIEVNFSPTQLRDPWLCERVLAILVRNSFPAQRFGIEITEDAIIADAENTRRVIESFKNQGARVALDDFGTGYSSLQHLRSLPFDRIKIDRSFVRDISARDGGDAVKIIGAIVSLAHSLDLPVTAEGIETAAHAELLRELGCDQGQGFYFGRPQAAILPEEPQAEVIGQARSLAS